MTAPRRKTGPKYEAGILEARRRDVYLDDLSVQMLRALGGNGPGALSRGIRHAARVAYQAYQNEPESPDVRA